MSDKRPSFPERTANAVRASIAAARFLKEEGYLLVSSSDHEERIAICTTCEEYGKYVEDECGECGCPVATRKAWLASTCCPFRMWYGDIDKTELCDQQEQEEKDDR